MPELPEVETIRNTLNLLIPGKTIREVDVYLPRIIQKPDSIEQFRERLIGSTFQTVERRGKFLRFILDDCVIVSHLRMEGKYGLFQQEDPLIKHTHVIFRFTDDSELRYNDVRQFGTMHLFELGEDLEENPLKKLGVEPLSEQFTWQLLLSMVKGRTTKAKAFLLDQEKIAGLGNIYVDEALFAARIHPETPVGSLKRADIKRLHDAIVHTLQEAVKMGGTTIKSYVNGQGEMGMFQQQLDVYGRKGEPCTSCHTPIERMKVAGRGTHYCPRCQPLKTTR